MIRSHAWLLAIHVIGLWFFFDGYLLHRSQLSEYSKCDDFKESATSTGCWLSESPIERVVIILIDALRFDFANFDDSVPAVSHCRNKLPIIRNKLADRPGRARLFRFMADAPTLTLLRIKGLTTGGLPTFIDVKNNFSPGALSEDNILRQLLSLNHDAVFMGDDTWAGLYPGHFKRNFTYPSFDVFDLHTVDRGCDAHIHEELEKDDWTLLIAHYLGVDHVGHKYELNHPAMSDKLAEMNSLLTKVMKTIDSMDSTLLLVFGDHGMTPSGDHGGSSEDEVAAALFMYSSQDIFAPSELLGSIGSETVLQTDIVPSISLLLGLPIPFGNLGAAIPELFTFSQGGGDDDEDIQRLRTLTRALKVNAAQVVRYLESYSSKTPSFPGGEVAELRESLDELVKLGDRLETLRGDADAIRSQAARLHRLLREARALAVRQWATFRFRPMYLGMAVLAAGAGLAAGMLGMDAMDAEFWTRTQLITAFVGGLGACLGALLLVEGVTLLSLELVGFGLVGVLTAQIGFVICGRKIRSALRTCFVSPCQTMHHFGRLDYVLVLLCIILYAGGHFSDSFIKHENWGTQVMSVTLIFAFVLKIVRYEPSRTGSIKYALGAAIFIRLIWALTFAKQTITKDEFFFGPQLLLSFGSVVTVYVGVVRFLFSSETFSKVSLHVYLGFAQIFVLFFYWVLEYSSDNEHEESAIWPTLLPRIVFLLSGISFLRAFTDPVACGLVRKRGGRKKDKRTGRVSVTPEFYLNVVGMDANHFTAFLLILIASIGPLMLVVGPQFPPVYLCTCLTVVCMIYAGADDFRMVPSAVNHAADSVPGGPPRRSSKPTESDPKFDVYISRYRLSFGDVCLVWLLAHQVFFTTGHLTQLNTLCVPCAYVGLSKFSFYGSGFLVLLHTFAGHILAVLLLSVLFLGRIFLMPRQQIRDVLPYAANLSHVIRANARRVYLQFACLTSGRIALTTLNAYIQRRHLMAFEIFAPKFLFDGTGTVIFDVLVIFCGSLICRVDTAFRRFAAGVAKNK
eukprot:427560_1